MAARTADLIKYCLTIILPIFLSAFLFAQPQDIKFEHLTTQNDLSDNRVLSIIQDSKGFMWFGTLDGLNRYDGYKFKIYKNDPSDSLSIGEGWIQTLFEDYLGELWIGTQGGGLCRYDRNRDTFIRYSYEKANPNSICGNQIVSIFETDQHVLWIGSGNGLNKYNRESDDFTRYYPDENKEKLEANVNYVAAISQDTTGRLWIGTHNEGLFFYDAEKDKFIKYKAHPKYPKTFINQFTYNLLASQLDGKNYLWFNSFQYGLYKINLENGEIRHYKHEPDNPQSIRDNRIRTLYQTGMESNELWIGTESGLDRFDIQTETFLHFQHQSENSSSRNYDPVWSIFKDKSGLIWVGTAHGVCKFDPNSTNFETIQLDTEIQEGLSGGIVWAIHEEGSFLWLGTDDGLYSFNRTSGQITAYKHDPQNTNSLSNNNVSGTIQSESGDEKVLWVNTGNGLNKIDLHTKRITRYYIPTNDPVHNQMFTLCEDENGMIWIGARGPYLYSFDPETGQFTRGGRYGNIRSLYVDSSGTLWIGEGGGGLSAINPTTKNEKHYRHITGDSKSISDNSVRSILEDRNGILWIGTGAGLNKFDRSTETFTCFDEKDGLISNKVRAVLEDRDGNLWISTDKGISKFYPNSQTFRNFTVKDGLHDDEFWWGGHVNDRGEMFFGGRNGLTYFYPDSIKDKSYLPSVVLTDFQIFNTSVKPGLNSPLKKQVSEVSEITLSHDRSIFSFEFAALEYHHPERIKYAYKMENVDPDWVLTDASRRFVTYTHLDAGEYLFRVKASNSDGVWNEQGISVKITILPPWWKTWWAYFSSAIIILATVYALRRYELSRQRFKHQMELEHLEAEKLQELDRMKSRFFANISHEFRTPLTLIKGPVEHWLPKMEQPDMRQDFQMTQRNTNRLLRLVNQLLDISRLESGKMKLQARPENIVDLTRQLTMAFESLACVNDIELRFKGPEEEITVYLDREHYEKIITNLLFNALKFTPAGGQVMVDLSSIRKDGNNIDFIEIKVTDTGTGIPADHLPHIFDRFYQGGDSYAKDSQGSGLGLALTKELVELHHGEIEVSSEVGKGTEFTIQLPLGKDHLKEEEIVDIPLNLPSKGDLSVPLFEGGAAGMYETDIRQPTTKDAPILLIVEDNADMRRYIREMLVESHKVVEAADGQEGFEKAAEIIPDIIISDVMMPEMDGFQFCEKIKTDERTSHIPIILLTAKSSGESKVEGLETGADDYLTKPFDARELQVRVKNLIEQRERLRERFQEQILIQPSDVTATSMDSRFLKRAIEFVEMRIDDTGLDVNQFSKEMALSRSQLNRKLRALTKQSATEFIRCLRLKRAAQLLEQRTGNISEIAYEVGFTNPSRFAGHFRNLFGVSPSKYISQK
jgi:signal transduction histidine kinase/ligand-binding sensor domain-containing protein/DNA-binding response OmpR family regulator